MKIRDKTKYFEYEFSEAIVNLNILRSNNEVTFHRQEHNKLCWAACVQMIVESSNEEISVTQCNIAGKKYMPFKKCCKNGKVKEKCNKYIQVGLVDGLFDEFNISSRTIKESLDKRLLIDLLDDGILVGVFLTSTKGIYHMILVHNYIDDMFVIYDPWPYYEYESHIKRKYNELEMMFDKPGWIYTLYKI